MTHPTRPRLLRGPRIAVYLALGVATLGWAAMPAIEAELLGKDRLAYAERTSLGEVDRKTVIFLRATAEE